MTGPSPHLATFVLAAIRRHVEAEVGRNRHPDELLLAEIRALAAGLVVNDWSLVVPSGPECSASAAGAASGDAGGGKVVMPSLAVSLPEAAELMSVSVSTVRRLIASDGVRSVRAGRRVLVTRAAIDDYLQRDREREASA